MGTEEKGDIINRVLPEQKAFVIEYNKNFKGPIFVGTYPQTDGAAKIHAAQTIIWSLELDEKASIPFEERRKYLKEYLLTNLLEYPNGLDVVIYLRDEFKLTLYEKIQKVVEDETKFIEMGNKAEKAPETAIMMCFGYKPQTFASKEEHNLFVVQKKGPKGYYERKSLGEFGTLEETYNNFPNARPWRDSTICSACQKKALKKIMIRLFGTEEK